MLLTVFLVSLVLCLGESSPTARVVNGIEAEPNSWPWQLSLQLDNSHICGAVVLNENFALTAAHCVDFAGYENRRFSVVCGAHDITDSNDRNRQRSVASDIRKHENWDANGLGFPNDIAVIRLSTPLRLGTTCQAANLPSSNDKLYANKDSTITGWGRVEGGGRVARYLKQAPILTLTHSDCRTKWNSFWNPIRTTHICIYDSSLKHGACNGDSGGPLVSPDHDTGLQTVTGVTSFGRAGCDTRYPSVYTRVSSYLGWISKAQAGMLLSSA